MMINLQIVSLSCKINVVIYVRLQKPNKEKIPKLSTQSKILNCPQSLNKIMDNYGDNVKNNIRITLRISKLS